MIEKPFILPQQERIIVIGDLHGDWDITIRSLKLGKLIDDRLNWIGRNTIVVQIGDQIDRCRDSFKGCEIPESTINDENSDLKILLFLTKLDLQAQKVGGRVFSLIGNHEIMNVIGDLRYVSYQGLKAYQNNDNLLHGRRELFKRGGKIAKFLSETRVGVLIIGNNLFVHGGLVKELALKYSLEDINSILRMFLINLNIDETKLKDIISNPKTSPFWVRKFGNIKPDLMTHENEICQNDVLPTLQHLKLDKMIIGHTPQIFVHDQGINSTCSNSLWRVDIGISQAFDNFYQSFKKDGKLQHHRKIQVLEILNDNVFNILTE